MNESTAWPATPQDFTSSSAPLGTTPSAGSLLNWRAALPSAAIAGVVSAGLSLVPILGLGLAIWMFASGSIAVANYRRREKLAWLPGGLGARLGALAGTIGFTIYSLFFAVDILLLRSSNYRQLLREMIGKMVERNPDPQVQQMLQWFLTPQGLATLVTTSLLFLLFGFLLLGTFGGALWAALTGRRPHET